VETEGARGGPGGVSSGVKSKAGKEKENAHCSRGKSKMQRRFVPCQTAGTVKDLKCFRKFGKLQEGVRKKKEREKYNVCMGARFDRGKGK